MTHLPQCRRFTFRSICPLLLRALRLDGILGTCVGDRTCIQLRVWEDWPRRLYLVQSCHLIQRLTIDLKSCFEPSPIPFPATKLPSLICLEFRGIQELAANSISPFMCCCDVVIRSGLLTAGIGESLCQSMVELISFIQRAILKHRLSVSPRSWHKVSYN
jgi:hypothetical protein